MEWCEYEALELEQQTKLDVYLARITAMLAAQLNPKGRFDVSDFLLGGEKPKKDLREMDESDVMAVWKAAVPHAQWTEISRVI